MAPVTVMAPVVLPIEEILPRVIAPAYVPVVPLELVSAPTALTPTPLSVSALVLANV
ncbi:hypothetical protein POBR111598_10030 [Polynucleobacter brandtiae]